MVELQINATPHMGLSIVRISLTLCENSFMSIYATEEGFDSPWRWHVGLKYSGIDWKPGHFFVRQLFPAKTQDRITKRVQDYLDALDF